MGKIEEHKGKRYLMVNDYMLDKVLDKIKEIIGIAKEVVYVTIGNPAFCFFLYLIGVHFRGELQHLGDISEKKTKCWPIRTQERGGVRL